jgi:hypothetical protein
MSEMNIPSTVKQLSNALRDINDGARFRVWDFFTGKPIGDWKTKEHLSSFELTDLYDVWVELEKFH